MMQKVGISSNEAPPFDPRLEKATANPFSLYCIYYIFIDNVNVKLHDSCSGSQIFLSIIKCIRNDLK